MSAIRRVAVMGAGTMGPGMGAVLARAGLETTLFDVRPEALERAQAAAGQISSVLDRLDAVSRPGGSLRYATDQADALAGVQLVIEAVPENLELKQRVYAEFERLVGPDVVLASNTSGIPVTRIAEGLARPERVIGMHWSNPPHLVPMIEVIPGQATAQAAVDAVMGVVNDVGYHVCLLRKEVPGFVENRVLYAIMRECLALVDEGVVSREDLDLNVQWGIGYKLAVIPPLQLLDMAGLDIYSSVASYLNQDLSAATGVSSTIRELADQGRLGIKTGGGIFDYTPEQVDQLRARRAGRLVAVRKALE